MKCDFSVVGHVLWRRTELGIGLDDLIHSFQKVLFGGDLSTGANGKHTLKISCNKFKKDYKLSTEYILTCFGTDGSNLGTS